MARIRVGRFPKEFRRMAVERVKTCDNIVELSQELGVHRRLLYKWRDQFDLFDPGEESPPGINVSKVGGALNSYLKSCGDFKIIPQAQLNKTTKTIDLTFTFDAKSPEGRDAGVT